MIVRRASFRTVLLIVVVGGTAGLAVEASAGTHRTEAIASGAVGRTLVGLAFATAVFASLVSWMCHRQSSKAPELWLAAAFGVLAAALAVEAVANAAGTSVTGWASAADPRTGVFLCVLILVMVAVLGPEVDTRVTAARAMLCAAVALVLCSVLIAGATELGGRVVHTDSTVSARSVHAATVALWVAATGLLLHAQDRHLRRLSLFHALMFGLLSVGAWAYVAKDAAQMPSVTVLVITLAGAAALGVGLREVHRRSTVQTQLAMARQVEAAEEDEAVRGERERSAATAHDVRSGLLAIEAALERLAEAEDDAARAVAKAAGAEAARLRREVSVMGEQRSPRVIKVLDALGPVLLLERARAVDLHVDIDEDAVACVVPDALITVVRVLLDNARRHAPLARVDVSARAVGDRMQLLVRDHACVLPPPSGCVPRLPGDVRRDSELHGIGLLSARRLVEQDGGTLRVDDSDPRGLAFLIDLPVKDAQARPETRPVDRTAEERSAAMMRRRSDPRAARPGPAPREQVTA